MRIAVCHQTFAAGDAIGNDVLGMVRILKSCGHDAFVLCEYNPHGIESCEVSHDFSAAAGAGIQLVIYHHSQAWKTGGEFVMRSEWPVAFKFHNITPAHFFEPFAINYAEICRIGYEQTRLFAGMQTPHVWLCDSAFNRDVVLAAGASNPQCFIAPPFNKVDQLLGESNDASVDADLIRFLFVGRFAPNKGHLALLDFCAAYRTEYGSKFEMIVVGAIDSALYGYWQKFASRARALDLASIVRVHTHLPDNLVHELFRSVHAYITFSEHEGFGVPVIEAQAVGLPVIGSGATAVHETAGPGQFLSSPPASEKDFLFYATLARAAACDARTRQSLVTNGRRNAIRRFVDDVVENAFLEPILPWLRHSP